MNVDEFWDVIETARASAAARNKPFDEALADHLATRGEQVILDYQKKFDEVHEALYRWDLWAAAYLIGGGCSDDGFIDFRAGLIAEGRDWYQKATDRPDSLTDHPAVVAAADHFEDRPLFYEAVNYAAVRAFEQLSGDEDAFWDALDAREEPGQAGTGEDEPAGENFDFDDEQEMRRRLPRLAAFCYGWWHASPDEDDA